jgi:hypothetical protein
MRILPQVLHMLENQKFFFTFSPIIASLQCSFCLEKSLVYQIFHLLGIDTDPDSAKLCEFDPIRIHNTDFQSDFIYNKYGTGIDCNCMSRMIQ